MTRLLMVFLAATVSSPASLRVRGAPTTCTSVGSGLPASLQAGVVRGNAVNTTLPLRAGNITGWSKACAEQCCESGPGRCHFWSVTPSGDGDSVAMGTCTLFPGYSAPADATGSAAHIAASASGAVYYGANDPILSPYGNLRGFNYFPASSMNDIDMWRDFDETEIANDLERASRAGFTFVRTWVNVVVWQAEGGQLTDKLRRFVALAVAARLTTMVAPFNAYHSCVSVDGTVPTYNFTAACFFTSPAATAATDPAWWASTGEPYVAALTSALPAGTPGLLLWDVTNEPAQNWGPFVLHFLRYFKSHTETPLTFGAASWTAYQWEVNGTTLISAVDVMSFHSYHSTWEQGLSAYDGATALARTHGKPVFTSELGCIARASSYDQGIELASAYGMGWTIWELMVLNRESEPGTVNRRNIHGILYADGTVRDTAAIAAVRGFYVNRGTGPSVIAPGVPNEENHGTAAIDAGRRWVADPNRSVTVGAGILDVVSSLVEASGTAPMSLPVSAFARKFAAAGATLTAGTMTQMVKLLEAQLDALATTMDGPVGVNREVAGHNQSQYSTWEPGIAIFHRPDRGTASNGSVVGKCCAPDHLALCG